MILEPNPVNNFYEKTIYKTENNSVCSCSNCLLWELLKWHPGVQPISQARSRRTVQVAQHDHRLGRLWIHVKNRGHSCAADVAGGSRLVLDRANYLWVRSSKEPSLRLLDWTGIIINDAI